MKQKFNLGDSVISKDGVRFVVSLLHINKFHENYSGENLGKCYDASELELYVETVNKKLYAYREDEMKITKDEIESKAGEMYGYDKDSGDSWACYAFVNGATWAQNKILEMASNGVDSFLMTQSHHHRFEAEAYAVEVYMRNAYQAAKLSSAKEIELIVSENDHYFKSLEKLQKERDELKNNCREYEMREDLLQKERDELVEALKFYGNLENWRNPKYPQKHDFNVLDSEDGRDVDAIKGGHFICGKRAREALLKIK